MISEKRDEFTFFYKNNEYILKSKLDSLVNIENELGYTILRMLSKWKRRGILTSEAIVVFRNTLINQTEKSTKINNKLIRKKDFLNLIKMIVPVFINSVLEKANNIENSDRTIWNEMFAVAVLHMGIKPNVFWQMSLDEFMILSKYYKQNHQERNSITDDDVKNLKEFISSL